MSQLKGNGKLDSVLIIEDEPDLAGLLGEVLRLAGYDVVLTTGSHAADKSIEIHPRAIVIDYLMPGLSGAQVIDRIRQAIKPENPPVILVTGLPNAPELAEETGAQAYLRKPFDVEELVSLVQSFAGPAEGKSSGL